MQEEISNSTYSPFKYPPDYALARIHQKATMPGQEDPLQLACPCCNQSIKKPFQTWWNRSIVKDFKHYGGGIVSYFWLAQLYCLAIILVILIYGIYLQYLTGYYCSTLEDEKLKSEVCSRFFGVWIITNEDLYDIIDTAGDKDVIIRFAILRSLVFMILLLTNALSLYLMKYYKSRYPDKIDVSQFSLLFKNLDTDNVEILVNQLRTQFGYFQIQQAFMLKQVQPFYSSYKKKLQTYYKCRNQQKPTNVEKLKKSLSQLNTFCLQHQEQSEKGGGRAIIVFKQLQVRQNILHKYQLNRITKFCMLLHKPNDPNNRFYCQQCPKPGQIIWQNIGTNERVQMKQKVLSIVFYCSSLALAMLILFLLSRILYFEHQPNFRFVIQNIILVIVVVIAIAFRFMMDRLADMRYPYTFTNRTMFIVITTVMLHFMFYLWLPSLYLNLYHDIRGSVLNLMSNQAIMAVIVQIILTSMDLFYCCWNSKRKQIQNEDKPYGCQQILHQNMQYPRFPFEFKLIILFKFWSLITFFSFHTPMVLFLIFIAVFFHFVKDKYNLYFHYRSEIIYNRVQYNFLKIYTNLFTVYMYIIFVHTQKHIIEYISGAILTGVALFVQLFLFRIYNEADPSADQQTIHLLSQLEVSSASLYKQKYINFLETIKSETVDEEIKNYLSQGSLVESTQDWSINSKQL